LAASFYQIGADNGQIFIGSARGTVATPTTLGSTDFIGTINFRGHDGSSYMTGARIRAEIDGITPSGDLPTRLVFSTTEDGSSSPTERMRIDSSGRLLVGTSTARANFFNSTKSALFQQEGAASTGDPASRFMSLTYGRQSDDCGIFVFAKHRATTVGGQTVVVNGDRLGELNFQGSDGTEFVSAAHIKAEVDATPGANDMPGRLVFSTTADGASFPTERLRIDSAGRVGIGTVTLLRSLSELLTINGVTPAALIRTSNATGNAQIKFNADDTNYAGIGLENTALVMRCNNNSTPTSRLRIDNAGKTRIGVNTNPGFRDTTYAIRNPVEVQSSNNSLDASGLYSFYGLGWYGSFMGGGADNSETCAVQFEVISTTSQSLPIMLYCIGHGTNRSTTSPNPTAKWALFKASIYNGQITNVSEADSGGDGLTFTVTQLAQLTYNGVTNGACRFKIVLNSSRQDSALTVWANTTLPIIRTDRLPG